MKQFPPGSLEAAVADHLREWETLRRRMRAEAKQILKRLLERASLRTIAKAVGLSPTYLSMVQHRRAISPEAFLKLAAYEMEQR